MVFFFLVNCFILVLQRMRECQSRGIKDIVSLVRGLGEAVRKCCDCFSWNGFQWRGESRPTSCEPPVLDLVPISDRAGVYSMSTQTSTSVIHTHKTSK